MKVVLTDCGGLVGMHAAQRPLTRFAEWYKRYYGHA